MGARPCKHCGRYKAIYSRGLCFTCYKLPGLKDQYPTEYRRGCRNPGDGHDPTAAEVEALVAEGMANLPDWWFGEKENGKTDAPAVTLSQAEARGLALRGFVRELRRNKKR